MLNNSAKIALREYEDQQTLATKVEALLKTIHDMVEKELGGETEGITFMPCLNVVCRLKSDPTSDVDPISFSVIKRPNSSQQIDAIVQNLLIKDPVFLSSIIQSLGSNLVEMFGVHFDMTSMMSRMGGLNEEAEVETEENETKDSGSEKKNIGSEDNKNSNREVN
jgi:hypothetical protein